MEKDERLKGSSRSGRRAAAISMTPDKRKFAERAVRIGSQGDRGPGRGSEEECGRCCGSCVPRRSPRPTPKMY